MNILLIVTAALTLLFVITGWRKGFVRMIAGLAAAVLAVLAVRFFLQPVKNFIIEKTDAEVVIGEKTADILPLPEFGTNREDIEKLDIPESIRDALLKAYDSADEAAADKEAALRNRVAELVLTAVIAAVLFLVVYIVLRLLARLFHRAAKKTTIGKIDCFLGAILGLLKAWILLSLFFIVITALAGSPFGAEALRQTAESTPMTWLYENNLLWLIVANV